MNYLWFDRLYLRIAQVRRAITSLGSGSSRMIRRLFGSRPAPGFQVRSSGRDSETDREAIKSIAAALDLALQRIDAERSGLKGRIEDMRSRDAIVGGNDTDDYLARTDDRSRMLSESDAEIRRGLGRLTTLEQNVSHFKFLRAALQTPLSGCKGLVSDSDPRIRCEQAPSARNGMRAKVEWLLPVPGYRELLGCGEARH